MTDIENYYREKKTIDIVQANKVALVVLLGSVIVFGVPFHLIWKPAWTSFFSLGFMFFFMLIAGIVLHELIHGLVFGLFAKDGFKSIRFGVMWKMLTPYCHCKEPLKIKHYFAGALMPAFLLGIVPAVISWFNGNSGWLLFGIFFTAAAAGDFMVVYVLRREDRNNLVQDHPSEAGCYVFWKTGERGCVPGSEFRGADTGV